MSIPGLVEKLAPALRAEYVAWTYELGSTIVGGRTIRAHLSFWPDFSFWWMGLIPEKPPFKTPGIYAWFRIRALERLYRERDCRGLIYFGNDRVLHRTLRRWCRTLQHPYQRMRNSASGDRDRAAPSARSRLPAIVQATGYLALKCWNYLRAGRPVAPGRGQPKAATIITYFPNIDVDRTRAGRFWSRYWEDLHLLLDEMPVSINWLWLYVDSDQLSFEESIRICVQCNAASTGKQRFFLIDQFGSVGVVGRAVRTYLRSVGASFRLRRARSAFHAAGSELNFFPLLARDWTSSLRGVAAMEGALTFELFRAAAQHLSPNAWTLFVWENQSWEHAALTAWRRHRNGPMVGVQHATLPPLDLRVFIDPRELQLPPAERRPIPDQIAVNGSGAHDLLQTSGFSDRLVVTEALRYSHLITPPLHRRPSDTLLVVTGFRRPEVANQLRLLVEAHAIGALDKYAQVLIKPHPLCPVEPMLPDHTNPFRIVKDPLSALWSRASAVFVANSTSAVAEALFLGVPTAVCLSDGDINLSPAFGHSGVPMIASAKDLAAFLEAPASAAWPADYLIVEKGLPRWRKLLTA